MYRNQQQCNQCKSSDYTYYNLANIQCWRLICLVCSNKTYKNPITKSFFFLNIYEKIRKLNKKKKTHVKLPEAINHSASSVPFISWDSLVLNSSISTLISVVWFKIVNQFVHALRIYPLEFISHFCQFLNGIKTEEEK